MEENEGVRPIFDRDDIIVNKESQEERMILTSMHPGNDKPAHPTVSRSTSQSSRTSSEKELPKQQKKGWSVELHTSRDYSTDRSRKKDYSARYRRSNSNSRKAIYRSGYPSKRSKSLERSKRRERSFGRDRSPPRNSKQRCSKSPTYNGPLSERRRSTSEERRSSQKYSRKSAGGRSGSYSPHHKRSRYSRSPYHDERRYERSKRSRTRSPRHIPQRRSRRSLHDEKIYEAPGIPNPYFEGAEFWVPNPMLSPRFIPRQMLAPGFPYPFRRGMPPMIPSRIPFRPRIVYNNRVPRSKTPQITSADSAVTTTIAGTSRENEESQHNATITESAIKNAKHFSTKNES